MLTVSCRPIFDVCLESVPRYGHAHGRIRSAISDRKITMLKDAPCRLSMVRYCSAQGCVAGHTNRSYDMRKFLFAIATLALLADPVMAMPIDPAPAAPTVSEGQFITAAYGHYRRVGRRTVRRAYRRGYYGGGYGYRRAYYGGGYGYGRHYYRPAYGHYRRVGRRTARRVYRRHF